MKKFEVGKVYLRPGLFVSSFPIKIIKRTDSTITFEELNYPDQYTTYYISYDNKGNEVVDVWEYMGEIGYMRA